MTNNNQQLDRMNQTVLAASHRKNAYIEKCFLRDFPDYISVADGVQISYDQIMEFVSRSKHMNKWFAEIMTVFRLTYEMPEIARKKLSVDKFNKVKDKLSKYAKSLETEGIAIAEEAKKFNEKLKNIQLKHANMRKSLETDDLVKILTLTSDQLPFKEQFKIICFNSETNSLKLNDSDEQPIKDKSVFQKKIFNDWLSKLLDTYNAGGDLNEVWSGLGKYSVKEDSES